MKQTLKDDYPIQTDEHKRILKKWFEETRTKFKTVKLAEKLTEQKALHFNVDQILNTAHFKPDSIYDWFYVIRNGDTAILSGQQVRALKLPGGFMVCPRKGNKLESQSLHFVSTAEYLKKIKGKAYNRVIYEQSFGDQTIVEKYFKKYFKIGK